MPSNAMGSLPSGITTASMPLTDTSPILTLSSRIRHAWVTPFAVFNDAVAPFL